MAWGEEKCTFCDALVAKDGSLTCKCSSKLVYREEPAPPASAVRLYHIRENQHRDWSDAVSAFDRLPVEDRTYWNEQAAVDRKRFQLEKGAYNNNLRLDEEILTDKEAGDECDCGNGFDDIRVALQRRRCEQRWSRYRRDHPRFNSTVKATDHALGPGTFYRFLALPTEIRDQIYTHLFQTASNSRGLRQWQLEYETTGPDPELRFTHLHPLDTRIFATSHQIYAESLDALYSTGCFVVDIARSSILPLFIQNPTGTLAPRPTTKIKRWHIQLTLTNLRHKDMVLPQVVALRDVMKQCVRLDEVRFTWLTVPHYWEEIGDLIREYDAMLSLFKDVHGVGKVIYTENFSQQGACREPYWLDSCSSVHLASEDVRNAVKASMEATSL
ncbi:MAG: hypothetical protein Q9211_002005 [Gyalolechia sp. 1 TL-2023]